MSSRIVVRRLRPPDLDCILSIEHASFGEDAYDRKLFAKFAENCGDLFLVAERDHRICGYLVACIRAASRQRVVASELISVATDPEFRGMGIASRLMDSLLRRLRRRGVDRLNLMVRLTNSPARALYEGYGFRRIRTVRHYYGDGADGLLMTLPLAPP